MGKKAVMCLSKQIRVLSEFHSVVVLLAMSSMFMNQQWIKSSDFKQKRIKTRLYIDQLTKMSRPEAPRNPILYFS